MMEDFGRNDMSYYFNHVYQDRGIMKWRGFFLSEHTSTLTKEEKTERLVDRLPQQMQEEIEYYLERSMKYNKILSIQLNSLNEFGNTKQHIIGVFRGFVDQETLMINDKYIEFSDIRHIQMKKFQKWSDTEENPFEEFEVEITKNELQDMGVFCEEYFEDFYEE